MTRLRAMLTRVGGFARRHKWPFIATAVIGSLLAAGSAYALFLDARISRFRVALHASRDGGETFLIVGNDSRERLAPGDRTTFGSTAGARSDILLLVRIPRDGTVPTLYSIPRDLLVVGRDDGLHRLGLEWQAGGPQTLVDTLCRSLGLGVDHVASFDLAGFKSLVDAVGGVDVDLPHAIKDRVIELSLPAGRQHLSGSTALQYVRARHLEELRGSRWTSAPNRRGSQAETILLAVAPKLRMTWDPRRVNRVLMAATRAVAIDNQTGVFDLVHLSDAIRRVDADGHVEIPARLTDAKIPYARLESGAGAVLARAGAGGSACPVAALPEARAVSTVGSRR